MSGYPEGTVAVVEQPIPMVSFYQERLILNLRITVPGGSISETVVEVEPDYFYVIFEANLSSMSSSLTRLEIFRKLEEERLGYGFVSMGYGKANIRFEGGLFENNYFKIKIQNYSDEDVEYFLTVVGLKVPAWRVRRAYVKKGGVAK